MKERIVDTINESPDDYQEAMAILSRLFRDEIFLPLVKLLKVPKKTLNSIEDLTTAISSGRISYYRGSFTGRFNSTISRELKSLGAEWDRKQEAWKIPQSKLPQSVLNAISVSEDRFTRVLQSIDKKLESVFPAEIADGLKIEKAFDKTLFKKEKDFQKNVRNITVPAQFTDHSRKELAKAYSENLKPYVKDFMEKEVLELRAMVKENVLSGNRYENLIKIIKNRYSVSQNKAKFLARQETSLMVASYRKIRAKDIGSPGYYWKNVAGTAAHPVRHDHKLLDNTFHTWDDPPIVNQKTGKRGNPGDDFNCRCRAKMVVKF